MLHASLKTLVLRRILWTVPVLLFALVTTFSLMHLAPGSPWDQGSDEEGPKMHLSETALRQLDAKYGLDRPWWEQLVVYVANVARLDFGDSYRFPGRSASGLLAERLPPTLVLAAVALSIIVPLGVGLGVLAALRHNSRIDYAITGFATVAASVPSFVFGILLMLMAVTLNRATNGAIFLPTVGFGLDRHLVMPVITLSLLPVAFMSRLARSSTLETLRQDHVRTAKAKGLPRRSVVMGHVLKNSLVPVITTIGPLLVFLISGTVVVESLFGIPGVGGAFVQAVAVRDYPVILAATLFYTAVVVVANLVVDILYAVLDPRVRVR